MGRYSNEKRAQIAAEAASKASAAGRTLQAQKQPVEEAAAPSDAPRPAPRNEPRRLAMEEIRSARGEPKDETPEAVEPVVEAKPVAEKPTVEKPVEDKPAPKAEAAPEAPEPSKMVKVKVDGEEIEVSQAEIDEAGGEKVYRLEKAAENRHRKANEVLAENRRTQAQIAQLVQQLAPKPPTVTDEEFLKSKVDVIRFGTQDESAIALREVLSRTNPRIDPDTITQQAVSRIQQTMALDNFKKEFHDVISNQIWLRAAVSLETERKRASGPDTDWQDFYRRIGNEVRSAAGVRQPQPTPAAKAAPTSDTPSQSPSDKEARKASIVNLPTAAARAVPPEDSKPETREESLNRMRKSRGLPTV